MDMNDLTADIDEPLGRPTTTALVIERLREEIRSGILPPGTRLRQMQVANRFGVSSTPVREAFTALQREGLLVSSPHRGVVVFQPTVADLRETYEIRIPLEALATRLAVEHITEDDLIALHELNEQMKTSEDYGALNREFHARIYEAARRPKLLQLISDMRDSSAAYLRVYATVAQDAPGADWLDEHAAILDALQARDGEAASAAMIAHLQHTVDRVSPALDEVDGSTDS
jgi:DNA-binding GntR family transcriptional regulator